MASLVSFRENLAMRSGVAGTVGALAAAAFTDMPPVAGFFVAGVFRAVVFWTLTLFMKDPSKFSTKWQIFYNLIALVLGVAFSIFVGGYATSTTLFVDVCGLVVGRIVEERIHKRLMDHYTNRDREKIASMSVHSPLPSEQEKIDILTALRNSRLPDGA